MNTFALCFCLEGCFLFSAVEQVSQRTVGAHHSLWIQTLEDAKELTEGNFQLVTITV